MSEIHESIDSAPDCAQEAGPKGDLPLTSECEEPEPRDFVQTQNSAQSYAHNVSISDLALKLRDMTKCIADISLKQQISHLNQLSSPSSWRDKRGRSQMVVSYLHEDLYQPLGGKRERSCSRFEEPASRDC